MTQFFITVPSGSNFSYREVLAATSVTIPSEQQMLTYQELAIQDTGELIIEGELILLF
jgi:hypothetical protein